MGEILVSLLSIRCDFILLYFSALACSMVRIVFFHCMPNMVWSVWVGTTDRDIMESKWEKLQDDTRNIFSTTDLYFYG